MKCLGEVKMYNKARSFGFILEAREHGTEQFFHLSDVTDRIVLRVGDLVTFEIAPSRNKPGTTQAVNVQLAKRDAVPSTPVTGVRP